MSATTLSTPASAVALAASYLARRPVWQVSYLSGLAAGVVVEIWGLLPLLTLSLAVPLTARDTATSTKLTLDAAHLIAGAVIVPIVAWRLSRVR